MTCIQRSLEDVRKLIHHAKLSEDELLPVTQMLEFTADFVEDNNDVVLLELDSTLLETIKQEQRTVMIWCCWNLTQHCWRPSSRNRGEDNNDVVLLELDSTLLETIKQEQRAVLRGDLQEAVVLCTKDKTYEVRKAETSNSLVLVPELSLPGSEEAGDRTLHNRQVCGIHYTYLEVRPCKPRIQKLRELLAEVPYSGPQSEDQQGHGQRNMVVTRVDAATFITHASHPVLLFSGFWQILEFDYRFKVVSHILNLIESKSWPLDGVRRCEAIKELSELEPRTVITQCFDYYLTPTDRDTDDGDTLYTLQDDKVCRLCAEVLLKSADKYNLNEFLNIWQQSVPEGKF
nr:sister chromatid cohesion protein DCC1-like [Cherax quadricarinatus]